MRQHKLLYCSSYDRGLIHLLKMWDKIIEKYPDATLDIAYGWDLFDKGYSNNPERMAWKDRVNKLMEQKRITHHGRISKDKLNDLTKKCGIWAYPTDFDEINCISALNCQLYGCVPCVINQAALKETVGSGIKVEGDIYDPEAREEYLNKLLDLMGSDKWTEESQRAIKFSDGYQWEKIATLWTEEF